MARGIEPGSIDHIKDLYAAYRHAPDLDARKLHFAPGCLQICRTEPSYAAKDRDTIVRYLAESPEKFKHLIVTAPDRKSRYSIRPLREDEAAHFGADAHVQPAGLSSVDQLRERSREEGWIGMRVDLWDVDGQGNGMLVKVHYWWGKQDGDGEWKQVLHDILYVGPLDGTEGSQSQAIED